MNTTTTLAETYADTHPLFRERIERIGQTANLPVLEVYRMWRSYSDICASADQSALLSEFIQWHKAQLGGNNWPALLEAIK